MIDRIFDKTGKRFVIATDANKVLEILFFIHFQNEKMYDIDTSCKILKKML